MPAVTELSLMLGGFLAFWLAPALGAVALQLAQSRRIRLITVSVAALTWLVWLVQILVWRHSFDMPIPGETVPNELFAVSNALAHACSAGCLVLLALAAVLLAVRVRRRSPDPEPAAGA